jgi:hypothetical protein
MIFMTWAFITWTYAGIQLYYAYAALERSGLFQINLLFQLVRKIRSQEFVYYCVMTERDIK